MPEKHLFEYAVIRAVPRVEREEFVNVGVILYCASLRFLQIQFLIDERKIRHLCDEFDIYDLSIRLQGFKKICEGKKEGGLIALLPMASRFRWLTSSRSTTIQTSKVHPGLCSDANETLEKLFDKLVI